MDREISSAKTHMNEPTDPMSSSATCHGTEVRANVQTPLDYNSMNKRAGLGSAPTTTNFLLP